MSRPALFALAILALSCARALAAPAGPELEPYRTLAHSAAAARLVAEAQAALAGSEADTVAARRSPLAAPDWPGIPRPVYVTLVRAGSTRACLGTDSPLGTLPHTVRALAARLRTDDRRRAPVDEDELGHLRLVIAFAGEPEPIAEPYGIDPMREGLRIESDRGAIAFLPGEARTVAWALREARRAGVLAGAAEARFARFAVITLSGPARAPTHE